MGIVRRRKIDVAADLPAKRVVDLPVELDDEAGRSIRQAERELQQRLVQRYRCPRGTAAKPETDEQRMQLIRLVAQQELEESAQRDHRREHLHDDPQDRLGEGGARGGLRHAARALHGQGRAVREAHRRDGPGGGDVRAPRHPVGLDPRRPDRRGAERAVDSFLHDQKTKAIVCSLSAAGVGINLQVASNVVLAELSWTAAEQQQAIDRTHRIGQSEPVTAWRIIAAHTIDARIAELVDSKASLAARALDGDDCEVTRETSVQLDALITLLKDALKL